MREHETSEMSGQQSRSTKEEKEGIRHEIKKDRRWRGRRAGGGGEAETVKV